MLVMMLLVNALLVIKVMVNESWLIMVLIEYGCSQSIPTGDSSGWCNAVNYGSGQSIAGGDDSHQCIAAGDSSGE